MRYAFTLEEVAPKQTCVTCHVSCFVHLEGDGGSSLSEKLARMLHKQDQLVLQRVKGIVEGQQPAVHAF